MQKSRMVIKKAKNNEPYVVVKGKNNQTIATTETYKRLQGARDATKILKRVVRNAVVMDKTKKRSA